MSMPRNDALTAAQQRLVQDHMHMADCLAGMAHNGPMRGVPEDSLRSSAHMGLVMAVRTYAEGKNAKFATHATLRIKGQFLDDARQFYKWSRGGRNNCNTLPIVFVEDIKHKTHARGGMPETAEDAFDRMVKHNPSSDLDAMISKDDIWHHLKKLGSPYSHVLYLRSQGVSAKHIAKFLGVSENWAHTLTSKAQELAKIRLADWLESLQCS